MFGIFFGVADAGAWTQLQPLYVKLLGNNPYGYANKKFFQSSTTAVMFFIHTLLGDVAKWIVYVVALLFFRFQKTNHAQFL